MIFFILITIFSFLFLLILTFFLHKFSFRNSYYDFAIGYTFFLLFTLLVVYIEELWKPIMGYGYDRLLFLVAITLGSLLNAVIVGVMAYREKIKKNILALSITIVFLAPLLGYVSFSAFQWYHLDRHKVAYCIENGDQTYTLRLNYESSAATIEKKIGPHAFAPYFYGSYNQQGDAKFIEGERIISKDSLQKRTYILRNDRLIGFPEKQDMTLTQLCN